MERSKPHATIKVWMETEDGYVFGPGVYNLLNKLKETGTLKEAASSLGMSYRFAWGLIRRAEDRLGSTLIESHKGGRYGGGGAQLTELGMKFLRDFNDLKKKIELLNEIERSGFPGVVQDTHNNGRTIIIQLDEKPTIQIVNGSRVKIIQDYFKITSNC